jgi:hypothetical protein
MRPGGKEPASVAGISAHPFGPDRKNTALECRDSLK